MLHFLRCVGRSVMKNVLGYLLEDNPVVKFGNGVCQDAYKFWKEDRPAEAERRADLEQLAQAPADEVRRQAEQIAAEIAPPEAQLKLVSYLQHLPSVVRRTLTRRDDPSGRTVPPSLRLDSAASIEPLLPERPPRFKAGDRPKGIGDWELVELLGIGGFGEVWKARNRYVSKAIPVALKFCLDETARERLLNHEAQVVHQVQAEGRHPGIVGLQHTYLSAEPPCLEYEYVDGGDLASHALQWHQANHPFLETIAWAGKLIHTLAETVGFAHRLTPPVVHRDLKPANILLHRRADGGFDVRVADFGIGLIVSDQVLEKTHKSGTQTIAPPNTILGSYTPLYASPQQTDREPANPTDDVHALGVIWHQLLTGDLREGVPTGLWSDELKEKGMPPEQVRLMGECVSRTPSRRPSDGRVLAERLANLLLQSRETTPETTIVVPLAEVVDDPMQQVRRDLATIRKANEDAAAAETAYDYDRGIEILDALEERLRGKRDAILYQRLYDKYTHVLKLESLIKADADAVEMTRITTRRIKELLDLKPAHWMGRYLDHCPAELQKGQIEAIDLGKGHMMSFAWVPPGTFWMGGGGGTPGDKKVEIAEGFALGIHAVTQTQWWAVMGNNPSYFSRTGGGKDKVKSISEADLWQFPVEQVSWEDVQQFLATLNERERAGEWTYCLPTEAEWEYSCRGAATSKEDCSFHFYFDHSLNDLSSKQANFDGNQPDGSASKGPYLERTTRVGSYRPNRLGLYDMHGNVWEWCRDWHIEGTGRVYRGGGWLSCGAYCQAADRGRSAPSDREFYLGFRVARVPSSK